VTVAAAQPVVLLVEDEELVRVMTQRYLGARGFTVLAASTGADAVRLVADTRPHVDVVLTDVVMPGMSGPDLVRRLDPMLDQPPVIFMSGYTADKLGPLDGSAEFMPKPFALDALAKTLVRVVGAYRARPRHSAGS
jgi:two-component system, cell cycle sensor histidine kinase and response regulator CckA